MISYIDNDNDHGGCDADKHGAAAETLFCKHVQDCDDDDHDYNDDFDDHDYDDHNYDNDHGGCDADEHRAAVEISF